MTEEVKSQNHKPEFVEVHPEPLATGVGGNIKPIFEKLISKFKENFESLPSKLQNLGDQNLLKMLKIVVLIFISVVVVAFVISRVVNLIKNGDGSGEAVLPTPTIVPYQTEKPSVYAEESQVLELERKAKELDKKMSDTVIKETILNPPSLDFDIEFNSE